MDIKFMKRALELANMGSGYVNPNPLVGAVIVKNDQIISEGYHEFYGGPHAEINAFKNAKEDVTGATMYVTLEPCSHYGKTGPCANAIVEKGIKEVIIAMEDPNPVVAGGGIAILRNNGIDVTCGIMEKEAKELNEVFIHYITTKTPYCIMKTAMTLDGKIATYTGHSKWITNEKSREYVHKIRNHVSGIMVGIGTVLADNPSLTTRLESGEGKDPIRIIVDSTGIIPLDSKVLNSKSASKTIIATTKNIDDEKLKSIKKKGAEVLIMPSENNRVNLSKLVEKLGEKKIDSILIEGGGTLNWSALSNGLVNKVISFIAPKIIGGKNAKTPVEGTGVATMDSSILIKDMRIITLDEDIVIEGYIYS
ncbi:bifunctional diaminohydroxyphosphoribosylaminopyrimidine deaminase/5-amino-6-(5-phosphoribosylamino)uracil reductase RibD [Clostridium sediminicola]|uniref:bifunctional diaminohydroxyphosphoribosylaminopyrimidine deaminase/5-amino-6-(5-phosphoribosylamino)uracil reductase RibD n=1 Tax=Clostridium sediminicola TaxID=3114879 RepID=UPI0031F23584